MCACQRGRPCWIGPSCEDAGLGIPPNRQAETAVPPLAILAGRLLWRRILSDGCLRGATVPRYARPTAHLDRPSAECLVGGLARPDIGIAGAQVRHHVGCEAGECGVGLLDVLE